MTLADVKAMLPHIDDVRARWRDVDRPATPDEMGCAVWCLVESFPNMGRTNPDMFSEMLLDDLQAADRPPTIYALQRACRLVRRLHEFLSVKVVFECLEQANDRASRIRYRLAFDLAAMVAQREAKIAENLAQAEKAKAKEEAERAFYFRVTGIAKPRPYGWRPPEYYHLDRKVQRARQAEERKLSDPAKYVGWEAEEKLWEQYFPDDAEILRECVAWIKEQEQKNKQEEAIPRVTNKKKELVPAHEQA